MKTGEERERSKEAIYDRIQRNVRENPGWTIIKKPRQQKEWKRK